MKVQWGRQCEVSIVWVLLFLLSLTLQGLGQTYVNRIPKEQGEGYDLSSVVMDESTLWTVSGSPYILESNFIVGRGLSLGIEEGVEVFAKSGIAIVVSGTLMATGVSFDVLEGDSKWRGFLFGIDSGKSSLERCVVRNAGGHLWVLDGPHPDTGLHQTVRTGRPVVVWRSSPSFKNCRFESLQDGGLILFHGASPTIVENSFGDLGATSNHAVVLEHMDCFPVMHGNSGEGIGHYSVRLSQEHVRTSGIWTNPGIPYHLTGFIGIYDSEEQDTILQIEAGTKFIVNAYGGLASYATLLIEGTDSNIVEFTIDAEHEQKPEWSGLRFGPGSDQSIIEHCKVSFGGERSVGSLNGSSMYASVYVHDSSPVFQNLILTDCHNGFAAHNSNFTLKQSRFERIQGSSIRLLGESRPRLLGVHFEQNGVPDQSVSPSQLNIDMESTCDPEMEAFSFANNYAKGVYIGNGSLSGDTVWEYLGEDVPYVIGTVAVPENTILTIEDGIVLKPIAGGVAVYGTLLSNGMTKGIRWTSFKDDTIAGDTNGDGDLTHPDPQDWRGIILASTAGDSEISGNSFSYGGNSYARFEGSPVNTTLMIQECDPIIIGNQFQDSNVTAIEVLSSGAQIRDNSFRDLGGGYAIRLLKLDRFPLLSGNSGDGTGKHFVRVPGGTLHAEANWSDAGIPYFIEGVLHVGDQEFSDVTLKIAPGAEIVFYSSGMYVNGTLIAEGSFDHPIRFGSYRNDPQPGDWSGLYFSQTAGNSVLSHSIIEYGGNALATINGSQRSAAMIFNGSSPTLSNVRIAYSSWVGLDAYGTDSQLQNVEFIRNQKNAMVLHDDSQPVLSHVRFFENGFRGAERNATILIEPDCDPKVSGTSFDGNALQVIQIESGSLESHTVWGPWADNVAYMIKDVTVPESIQLRIEPGTVIKSYLGKLSVYGTLLSDGEDLGIVWTSYADDTYAGDTNGDESQTNPMPRNWRGIYLAPGSRNSVIKNNLIAYGGDFLATVEGASTYSNLILHECEALIEGNRIEHSGNDSLIIWNSDATIKENHFHSSIKNGFAIRINALARFPRMSGNTYSGEVRGFVFVQRGVLFGQENWAHPGFPYWVDGNIEIGDQDHPDARLEIEPGCEILFSGDGLFSVHAQLKAEGTPIEPVYFGSNQANPLPGNWRGIYFSPTAHDSSLKHCIVEYGGHHLVTLNGIQRFSALVVNQCQPQLSNLILRNNKNSSIMFLDSSAGLSDSLIDHSGSPAVLMDGGEGGFFVNNTVVSSSRDGLLLNASAPRIMNNIFANNKGAALLIQPDQAGFVETAGIHHNLSFENGNNEAGADTLVTDPIFVDIEAGDYRLGPGSPAIDVGYVSQGFIGSHDLSGAQRFFGSSVDIGAYEYVASLSTTSLDLSARVQGNEDWIGEGQFSPHEQLIEHTSTENDSTTVFEMKLVYIGNHADSLSAHWQTAPFHNGVTVEVRERSVGDITQVLGSEGAYVFAEIQPYQELLFTVQVTFDQDFVVDAFWQSTFSIVGSAGESDSVELFIQSSQTPRILKQPQSQMVYEFGAATFSVTITGSGPFDYQWYHGETVLCGETDSQLVLPSVRQHHEGGYYVEMTVPSGEKLKSALAVLTVTPIGLEEEIIFNNVNIMAVFNEPSTETVIELREHFYLTFFQTYHWNNSQGKKSGTLALQDQQGNVYGPWHTYGRCGQGGVLDAYWTAFPMETIPQGIYTVLDSDPSTWSQNSGSNGEGMAWLGGVFSSELLAMTLQPADITIGIGQKARLSVQTEGENVSYQWYEGSPMSESSLIAGATDSTFESVSPIMEETSFYVLANNTVASVTSRVASVRVDARSGSLSNPIADPGSLISYRGQIGLVLYFHVTGSMAGSGWGTGIYTDDSSLSKAVVHSGLLSPDESGIVQVTLLPGQNEYTGSEQNGVTTSSFGSWLGSYSIAQPPSLPQQEVLRVNISVLNAEVVLTWDGGNPPFTVKGTASLNQPEWTSVMESVMNNHAVIPIQRSMQFYKIDAH